MCDDDTWVDIYQTPFPPNGDKTDKGRVGEEQRQQDNRMEEVAACGTVNNTDFKKCKSAI